MACLVVFPVNHINILLFTRVLFVGISYTIAAIVVYIMSFAFDVQLDLTLV